MNILYVSAVLPYPLTSGGQIRIYNLLKRLSVHHKITLVSFIRSEAERELASQLDFCSQVHMVMRGRAWQPRYLVSAILGKFPFLMATYRNDEMRQLLADILVRDAYQLIHLEPFYVWPALPKTNLPIVISEHNVEYAVYGQYVRRFAVALLRPLLWLDVVKLAFWEAFIWKRASSLTAVSDEDAQVMQKSANEPVSVVANGVDIKRFAPLAKKEKRTAPTLLFVGDFRWFPNVDAVKTLIRTIWPAIVAVYPAATLRVVGRNMPKNLATQIEQAGALAIGDVEDIAVEYASADFLVAPHGISGGTKFKMLEAMASGLCIVTTTEGAAGLGMLAGKHYAHAETPEEVVSQIQHLWQHSADYKKLVSNARTLVTKQFTWDVLAKRLDSVWKKYETA
jgi:glycosyltransferase involved in cell wall biosynthesis